MVLMKQFFIALLLTFSVSVVYSQGTVDRDTMDVLRLNTQAYNTRLTDPQQTVNLGEQALELAQKLNYNNGIAEAYRVKGIGEYYLNQPEAAINSYINALSAFSKVNNLRGEAKISNNIGNLYRDNDYDRSLEYFQKALDIGNRLGDKSIIATSYLNLGSFYFRKNSFNQALKYYYNSQSLFSEIKDSVNIILCSQNQGVAYFNLNELDKAEKILKDANIKAKDKDMNESVASIDLTLAKLYMGESKFDDAQAVVKEGLAYADIVKDERLGENFNYTSYLIALKRKDYQNALAYLQHVYHQDSTENHATITSQLNLFEIKHKQQEQEKENELITQRSKYDQLRFGGVTIVAGLLLIVIVLLISNVKRKAKTNDKLTELNEEISRQKDNLNRVNHHLEEIIDERTKDLQIKNKKLSEYSSYLSHQIRGPIATLKGLMNLEREGLVDKEECINMMNKCVSEIDEKIIEMSDMMHDPGKAPF
jgi:tetratricopeptide (TPR) repeat protein